MANFFRVKISVYPGSVLDDFERLKWGTETVSPNPILEYYLNIVDLDNDDAPASVRGAIANWLKEKMLEAGKEQFYAQCPKEEA